MDDISFADMVYSVRSETIYFRIVSGRSTGTTGSFGFRFSIEHYDTRGGFKTPRVCRRNRHPCPFAIMCRAKRANGLSGPVLLFTRLQGTPYLYIYLRACSCARAPSLRVREICFSVLRRCWHLPTGCTSALLRVRLLLR
jgi:hypothetical protein